MNCIKCQAILTDPVTSMPFEEDGITKAYVTCRRCGCVAVGEFHEGDEEIPSKLTPTLTGYGRKTREQMLHAKKLFEEANYQMNSFSVKGQVKLKPDQMNGNLLLKTMKEKMKR